MPALHVTIHTFSLPPDTEYHPAISAIITTSPVITERRASEVAIRARRIGTIGGEHLIREVGLHNAVIINPLDAAITPVGITRPQHSLQTVILVSKTILVPYELGNSRFVDLIRSDWILGVDRRVVRAPEMALHRVCEACEIGRAVTTGVG